MGFAGDLTTLQNGNFLYSIERQLTAEWSNISNHTCINEIGSVQCLLKQSSRKLSPELRNSEMLRQGTCSFAASRKTPNFIR